MSQELAGKTVDSFVIVWDIARGPGWSIWRARDGARDRDVTVTLCEAPPGDGPGGQDQFRRYAAALVGFSHPNLLPVLSTGELEGRLWSVSELARAHTLEEMIEARGRLETSEAVEITRQAAEGLHAAHERGVLHHGLRPSDILIDVIGRTRVTNFGLSRSGSAAGGGAAVSADADPADIAYLSPEQCRGEPADARADVYAAGAILYRMLAGAPPFESLTVEDLVEKITTESPPLLSDFRPGVADDLVSIVNKALEFDPAERFSTARAFAEALERFKYKSFEATSVTRATRQIGGGTVALAPQARAAAGPGDGTEHSPDSIAAMSEPTYRLPSDSEFAEKIRAAERALARQKLLTRLAVGAMLLLVLAAAVFAFRVELGLTGAPAAATGNPVPAAGIPAPPEPD